MFDDDPDVHRFTKGTVVYDGPAIQKDWATWQGAVDDALAAVGNALAPPVVQPSDDTQEAILRGIKGVKKALQATTQEPKNIATSHGPNNELTPSGGGKGTNVPEEPKDLIPRGCREEVRR